MRVVHAFRYYYPIIGGMERAVQGLAEAQAQLGHEVHVITSECLVNSGISHEEVINNVRVHRIDAWCRCYPDLIVPKNIPKDILRKADIVHVHYHRSLFSIKILEEASKLGVKTACYLMAVNSDRNHPNIIIRLLAPVYEKRNIRKAISMANLLLVKNLRDQDILRKKYGIETRILPDGIPEYYLSKRQGDPSYFFEKFKIRHDKIFLFIGRIHKLKGPHILIRALKYLGRDIAVVLVGPDNGYLSKTLGLAKKLGVEDRVYYLGRLSEDDKIWAIDSAIALVLPSIADNVEVYPMVISEAWAREKPVIASNVGGVPFRVQHGICGLLVEPRNPKALAEAMVKLAYDEKLARKMGKQCRNEVYTWKEIALKSIELYGNIMDDGYIENENKL